MTADATSVDMAVSPLDRLVYEGEGLFAFTPEEAAEARLGLLRDAFAHHFEENAAYAAYSQRSGFGPESIRTVADLDDIPLLAVPLFKRTSVRTGPSGAIAKRCESSGTSGRLSIVERDEPTLQRFLGSVRVVLEEFLDLDDALVVNLGPSTSEAADLWVSYVLSLVDLVFPTRNLVRDGVFHTQELPGLLADAARDFEHVLLVGTPIMYVRLLEALVPDALPRMGRGRLRAVTAGGWKRHTGEALRRPEFDRLLCSSFPGLEPSGISDVYNMVELNTVLPECAARRKHVPPWLHVTIRDTATLEVLPPGHDGLFAFCDPTASSYPAFCLTEDVCRLVEADGCPCGRRGPTLEVLRRLARVEQRGCALKTDSLYTQAGK